MKKIIYMINARIPTEAAHGYQVSKMCEQLASNNVSLELWIPTRDNQIKDDAFEYYGLGRNFEIKKIKSFDFLRFVKYLGKMSFWLQSWLFFAKLAFVKIDKNTIIYTRNPEIVWLFSRRGYKTVYECHEWFRKGGRLSLWFLKKVDRIITTNRFIKDEFIQSGFDEKMILTAPNGIDLDIFNINMDKAEAIRRLGIEEVLAKKMAGKKVLMYTGGLKLMGVEKGVDEILQAVAILNRHDVVFVAVGGNNNDIGYYEKKAEELKIKEQVIFFPRFHQAKLALFQKAADILLMPFPKIAHYEFYMSPLKMFEYMAAKRPIIASWLPSIKEILVDYFNDSQKSNAILVEPGNIEDLASAINKIISEPALAEKIANQAFLDVKKFSWPARARKIAGFLPIEPQ